MIGSTLKVYFGWKNDRKILMKLVHRRNPFSDATAFLVYFVIVEEESKKQMRYSKWKNIWNKLGYMMTKFCECCSTKIYHPFRTSYIGLNSCPITCAKQFISTSYVAFAYIYLYNVRKLKYGFKFSNNR